MPAGSRSVKVVIVDDSALLRQRLAAMISRLSGVEIAGEARSVAQALELIRRWHPQAVVLDIRLKSSEFNKLAGSGC